jgi:anti-anti-sigma regulatory factor
MNHNKTAYLRRTGMTDPGVLRLPAGPLTRAETDRLCGRLAALLRERAADSRAAPATVDTSDVTDPQLDTVEALARLQLTARRLGSRIRLHGTHTELADLLAWTGVDELLLQPHLQAEQRKQPLGVQEGVEAGDPPV